MKKFLFLAALCAFSATIFTSCNNSTEAMQQQKTVAPSSESAKSEVKAVDTTTIGGVDSFHMTKPADNVEKVARNGGDCFDGKGEDITATCSSTLTVFVLGHCYSGKIFGESEYATGSGKGNCADRDPGLNAYKLAQKQCKALADAKPDQLTVTVKESADGGWLQQVTVRGKKISENVYEDDVVIRLIPFNPES